jgi:hypothetical protein
MTVTNIATAIMDSEPSVWCMYFDDKHKRYEETFPPEALNHDDGKS